MNKLWLAVLLVGLSVVAKADTKHLASINVCNKGGVSLDVAIALERSNSWEITGWYVLKPDKCKQVLGTIDLVRGQLGL